ncbi:MAG: sugar MFS transporter [Bacteroidota bacterium]|nr:sugar MFS transporter [Bacteroidota bacterium]
MKKKSNAMAMTVITSLFFMWGLITVLNDILIPYLKNAFELTYLQAMLVQFAFFGAYFIGGLLYFLISLKIGDPINKIGYKNGIILGLLISATGTALFYPAANFGLYGFFLAALFVLGLGFAMLQIAANPYVAILGPSETASSRLNLSQGFNSFGTTIGPIIGGYFIFEFFGKAEAGTTDNVIMPYLFLTAVLILIAFVIWRTDLPRFTKEDNYEDSKGALRFRHLKLGALGIFVYVGAEVAIGSILISYLMLDNIMGFTEAEASPYVAFYWGGAMIGRFVGSIALSKMKNLTKKYSSMAMVSLAVFGVVFFSFYLKTYCGIQYVFPFMIFLVLNFVGFVIGKSLPGRTLTVFAVMPIVLLLVTMMTNGAVAMWAVLGIGIFNSIMWSNVFTLAIRDLGKYTSQGSSILVMFILGGAIIPPIQGGVADMIGVQLSFFVPIICYLYLAYYGWKGYLTLKERV